MRYEYRIDYGAGYEESFPAPVRRAIHQKWNAVRIRKRLTSVSARRFMAGHNPANPVV